MRLAVVLAVIAAAVPALADPPMTRAPTSTDDRLAFDPQTVYRVPRGDAPSVGPADAPITIVAWSDYACGYCNRVQDTLDRLERLYPGQIRWVYRTLLLDEDSTVAAEGALAAAAQGKFAAMHARLYALHGQVDRADVELLARELGLDMIRFRADLDAGSYRKQLAADLADARALGISGTPTFFINGRVVNGNQPLSVFAQVVAEELARAAQAGAGHPPDLYQALVASGKASADAAPDVSNDAPALEETAAYRVGLGLPGHQLGPDDAPVTIVEWSDFECPFCAKQAPILAQLRAKYGDQLRVVYRHYPVLFHRDSVIAAEAGVAAAEQGKFWAFHDQVFGHFGQLARADLETYATAAGLDLAAFRAALDTRRYHDAVIAEGAAAQAMGVTGTPTLFINGQPIIGQHDFDSLDKIVAVHLDHARAAIARGLPRGDVYPVVMAMAKGEDLADPSAVPEATHLELRGDDRGRAVVAACRRHDAARATRLAGALAGDPRRRAAAVCAGEGIDLP